MVESAWERNIVTSLVGDFLSTGIDGLLNGLFLLDGLLKVPSDCNFSLFDILLVVTLANDRAL